MKEIRVTFPDGSQKTFEAGIKVTEITHCVSKGLAESAVVARVDGRLTDLSSRLDRDAKVTILTDRNPEALEVYRHSSAHLLALAVLELFPDTQLGIGPPVENGFYYDFLRKEPFTTEDLEKIEQRMLE